MDEEEIDPLSPPPKASSRRSVRSRRGSRRSSVLTSQEEQVVTASSSQASAAVRVGDQTRSAADRSARNSRSGSVVSFAPDEFGKGDVPMTAWAAPSSTLHPLAEVGTPETDTEEKTFDVSVSCVDYTSTPY